MSEPGHQGWRGDVSWGDWSGEWGDWGVEDGESKEGLWWLNLSSCVMEILFMRECAGTILCRCIISQHWGGVQVSRIIATILEELPEGRYGVRSVW